MGEGAGAVVLESAEHAAARGATILGEIAGVGISSDGYHIAAPDPEGRGVVRALRGALESAGLSPSDVTHINAHATSTPAGDVAEAKAIREVFGSAADGIVVTAPKSTFGHLLRRSGRGRGHRDAAVDHRTRRAADAEPRRPGTTTSTSTSSPSTRARSGRDQPCRMHSDSVATTSCSSSAPPDPSNTGRHPSSRTPSRSAT